MWSNFSVLFGFATLIAFGVVAMRKPQQGFAFREKFAKLFQSESQLYSMRSFDPLGFPSKSGLEELHNLLQISQPTNSPNTRKIVLLLPTFKEEVGIPDEDLNQLPGVVATAEFYRIIERRSSPPPPPKTANNACEGIKGSLSGGGSLYLRVKFDKSPVTASLEIVGYSVPGYEVVTRLEFVIPEFSSC